MVASCIPDVVHSSSCWRHDPEEERTEREMIPRGKQGVLILIAHVRKIKKIYMYIWEKDGKMQKKKAH